MSNVPAKPVVVNFTLKRYLIIHYVSAHMNRPSKITNFSTLAGTPSKVLKNKVTDDAALVSTALSVVSESKDIQNIGHYITSKGNFNTSDLLKLYDTPWCAPPNFVWSYSRENRR